MIIFDLLVLIIFLSCYLAIRKKNQFNIFSGAVAILLADVGASMIAKPIFNLLLKSGWQSESYVTALIYLVIIILLWGLIYAIISSFNINFSNNISRVMALVSALLISVGVAIAACFIASNITSSSSNIYTCRLCAKAINFYLPEDRRAAFVPANMQEVYNLPKDAKIIYEDTSAKAELLQLVNNERLNDQRPILVEDLRLADLAQNYANSMVGSLRFSHIDANNNTPDVRARLSNIEYVFLGENLAIAPTIKMAHDSLMASQNHRSNILSSKFQKIGVSCYMLSTGSYIIVEEFSN